MNSIIYTNFPQLFYTPLLPIFFTSFFIHLFWLSSFIDIFDSEKFNDNKTLKLKSLQMHSMSVRACFPSLLFEIFPTDIFYNSFLSFFLMWFIVN